MARKRAAANLYHKPLQTREPRDRKTLGDYLRVIAVTRNFPSERLPFAFIYELGLATGSFALRAVTGRPVL